MKERTRQLAVLNKLATERKKAELTMVELEQANAEIEVEQAEAEASAAFEEVERAFEELMEVEQQLANQHLQIQCIDRDCSNRSIESNGSSLRLCSSVSNNLKLLPLHISKSLDEQKKNRNESLHT